MGAVTNLALRHQPSNQICYWYLLRTHLASTGFGINPGWRGPEPVIWEAGDMPVLSAVSALSPKAGLAVDAGQHDPALPRFGEH